MRCYFKICLWSPIWFPVLLVAFAVLFHGVFGLDYNLLPFPMANIVLTVMWSILFGGIQYLIALMILWKRFDFDDFVNWLGGILLLPILFTLIQLGTMVVLFTVFFENASDLAALAMIAGFDLGLGYGYVACWVFGYFIIKTWARFFRKKVQI